jgi:hypothetical protein
LTLGFECLGKPGPGRLQLAATLTTANNTEADGAQGWSLSIGVAGYRVVSLTTDDTAAASVTAVPPGFWEGGFNKSEPVDPARVVGGSPQGPGLVMGLLLALTGPNALPRNGMERLLIFELEEDPPGGPGPHRVFYVDGKQGSGQPVRNVISLAGTAQVAALESFEGACVIDCNKNGQDDDLDIALGTSKDCNLNRIADECEPDCNANGIPDDCDLTAGTETDCNQNGILDSCDGSSDPSDCNGNGEPDNCDLVSGQSQDCNRNDVPDSCDIAAGAADDVDRDGVPDSCQPDCNGNRRPDAHDIATGASADANGDGIPDECADCARTEPIPCPDGTPRFRYSLLAPCVAFGEPGMPAEVVVRASIEQYCIPDGGSGVQGWLLGVRVLDCTLKSATTGGTAAAPVAEGGLWDGGFRKTDIVDPARNGGKRGVVSAIVLSFTKPATLPPANSPHDVLRMTLEEPVPPGGCAECVLAYEDGLQGSGQPVRNGLTYQGATMTPELSGATFKLCPPSSGGSQKPGDANQDAKLDLSDPVWLLNHLFLGLFPVLPCEGGTAGDPGAGALGLLDVNGDRSIDLSDPVSMLTFLFSAGNPPALGTECVPIDGCSDRCP